MSRYKIQSEVHLHVYVERICLASLRGVSAASTRALQRERRCLPTRAAGSSRSAPDQTGTRVLSARGSVMSQGKPYSMAAFSYPFPLLAAGD